MVSSSDNRLVPNSSSEGDPFAKLNSIDAAALERIVALLARRFDWMWSEDIESKLQSAMVELLRQVHHGKALPANVPGWLFVVARHKVIREVRRRRVERQALERNVSLDDAVCEAVEDDIQHMLDAILATLTPRELRMVNERKTGKSLRDVATVMGLTAGEVDTLRRSVQRKANKVFMQERET